MFKKLIILTLSIFFLTLNANSASDGELTLNKDEEKKQIKDCFEKLNRATFSFNQGLDKAIIKPLAKGYRKLPDPIQKGTTNAVKNLSNLITIPNNLLQGEIGLAGEIRPVPQLEKRIVEVIRLGVEKCIIPKNSKLSIDIPSSLSLYEVSNIQDAINICLK